MGSLPGSWFGSRSSASSAGGGIPEAPIDGQQYARRNAAWTPVINPDQLGLDWASFEGIGTGVTGGCFYNGLFYFSNSVSGNGIITSPDGKLMTYQTTPSTDTTVWYDVTGANGTLIAVGKSGTYNVMRSTDNGATWNYITGSTAATSGRNWRRVTTNGQGIWMACAFEGSATDNIMVSTDDGLTWTRKTLPVSTPVTDIWYGDGYWFCTRYDATGGVFRSDDNGDTWTALTFPAEIINTIAGQYANGVCYAISQNGGANGGARSLDRGNTWELMDTINTGDQYLDIEYGNGITIIVNRGSIFLYSDDDGATWYQSNAITNVPSAALKCLYGNGVFVIRDTYGQYQQVSGALIDTLLPINPNTATRSFRTEITMDGSTTLFTITHPLGTLNITASIAISDNNLGDAPYYIQAIQPAILDENTVQYDLSTSIIDAGYVYKITLNN